MRRLILLAASVLVSALFLWLALRGIGDPEKIIDGIRQADPAWLLLNLVFILPTMWTRAVRWRGLTGFKIPIMRAFHIINITFIINQLPLRAGEVARSLLATREGVPFVTAATSIVVERLLDTLLVVVVLAVSLSQSPNAPDLVAQSATLFGIVAVVGFVTLIIFARYPAFARSLLATFERYLPLLKRLPLHRLLDHFIDGLQPLTNWRGAAHAIGWTIIGWTFSWFNFYLLHRALGLEGDTVPLSVSLSLTLASFSIAIPVTVAAIGPFEGAVIVAGQTVIPPTLWPEPMYAVYAALGFVIHGMTVLAYAILGTIGMVVMGVSLGDVLQSKSPSAEDAEAG